jgi:hypothetical protein
MDSQTVCQLARFLKTYLFCSSFQRAYVRTAAHKPEVFLSEPAAQPDPLESDGECFCQFHFDRPKGKDEACLQSLGLQSVDCIRGDSWMISRSNTVAVAMTQAISEPPGDMGIYRFTSADDLADLVHLCGRRGSDTTILAVHLAIPPTISGQERWISLPVVQLLRGNVMAIDGSVEDTFFYRLVGAD